VIDLTKDKEEVVKTCFPIIDEILPATENPTQDLTEDKATQENKWDTMMDTHDQGGGTT
jgi:hypothetical protein